MDAFIYFPPGLEIDRDTVEAALEDALGEAGEVTGAGSGVKGANLDLHIDDKAPVNKVLAVLREALTLLGVKRAKIVINRVEYRFPS